MASTAVRNANRNAVHAARPGSRPAIHVDAKPTPTAPVPEDTALLDGLTASVSAADAKKAAAAEKRAAAKLAKEAAEKAKAEAAKTATPDTPKTAARQDLARRMLMAVSSVFESADGSEMFLAAFSKAEASQIAANMIHHFPAGKNEDGTRWWVATLPKPDRSDWR